MSISNRVKPSISSQKLVKAADEDVDDDDDSEKVNDLKKRTKEKNKTSKLIGAFETNIDLETNTPKNVDMQRKKVVNTFKLMMESSGGEKTPSPGMKRKLSLIHI